MEKETTKSANAPYYVLHIAWNHAFSRRSRAVTAKKSTKKRDALNVGLRKAELDSTLRVQHRATRIDVLFAWLPVPGISGEKAGNEGDYENLSFSLFFDLCLNVILTILIL